MTTDIDRYDTDPVYRAARCSERGARVLDAYAAEYYPGAESTDDADGAFTVASDVISDLLHTLKALGHDDPERVLAMASVNYVEEAEA